MLAHIMCACSSVSFRAALKVLLLGLTIVVVIPLRLSWRHLDLGTIAGFADLQHIAGLKTASSTATSAKIASYFLDSFVSGGPVWYDVSALPSCARHIVVDLFEKTPAGGYAQQAAANGTNGENNATLPQTTRNHYSPQPSCQAILHRDESALTSRECAEKIVGAFLPSANGIQPASLAKKFPMTADTSPLAIVRIEMPRYMHHRQSGRPRMYAFFSTASDGPHNSHNSTDEDSGIDQGIRCNGIRPIIHSIPIDGHLVSVASLRKIWADLLWEDTDISESNRDSTSKYNTLNSETDAHHPAPQMFDKGSIPQYFWVKWRTATELDQRAQWMLKYVGRPGSVFIHDWDDPGSLLEAEDPSPLGHRIHYCLKKHFFKWRKEQPFSGEPFFEWLDYGTGRRIVSEMQMLAQEGKRQYDSCIDGLDERHTKFLTKDEAKQYLVQIKRKADGHNYIRWKESKELLPKMRDGLLFVWDMDKHLYAFIENRDAPDRLAHTSITAAGPLLAAGEFIVGKEGRLKDIEFSSGHYKPKYEHFLQMFKWFRNRGLALGRKFVRWDGHDWPSDDF